MQHNERKIWFPAKKYGWGWGLPCSWQGWVVFAALLVLTGGGAVLLLPGGHVGLLIAFVTILSLVGFIICLLKGEKPRWRWGKD